MNKLVYHGSWVNERPAGVLSNERMIWTTTNQNTAVWFGDRVNHLEIRFEKPFVVDARGNSYLDIPRPNEMKDGVITKRVDTDTCANFAFKNGYDSCVIKNVYEGSGNREKSDVIIIKKENIVRIIDEYDVCEEHWGGGRFRKLCKKDNEMNKLNEQISRIRGMMGLSEGRIYITANEVPDEILAWARGKVGSNFSKNIVIQQESRVEIGMPWHEADREYWQFFKLTGTQSATQVGDVVGRSGLEGDGVVTGKEVDGYVNVPSGYVLACAGTYPVRLTLYTADDAMKPVGSGDDLDKLSINQLLILLQAKGLKSAYRDKFPEDEYAGLIAGGYLASNKSITTKGRNMVEDPALKKKIEDYAESKGMYLDSSYKLSKKFY